MIREAIKQSRKGIGEQSHVGIGDTEKWRLARAERSIMIFREPLWDHICVTHNAGVVADRCCLGEWKIVRDQDGNLFIKASKIRQKIREERLLVMTHNRH